MYLFVVVSLRQGVGVLKVLGLSDPRSKRAKELGEAVQPWSEETKDWRNQGARTPWHCYTSLSI
jgi:hypothetical protein